MQSVLPAVSVQRLYALPSQARAVASVEESAGVVVSSPQAIASTANRNSVDRIASIFDVARAQV